MWENKKFFSLTNYWKSTMFLLFATIIALSSAAPDIEVTDAGDNNDNHSICNTQACTDAASYILKNMNSSVDPCENFYQFSCGKFIEETTIPDDQSKVDAFTAIEEKLLEQLFLLGIPDKIEDNDPSVLKLIKSYYQICMDTDQIEKNSKSELREILKNVGGCPVLEGQSWDETKFDWKKSVYEANKMGYDANIFFSADVVVDPNNSTRHVIIIKQATTEVPIELLLNKTKNTIYSKIMTDTVEFFGMDVEQAKEELSDSLSFEIGLILMSIPDLLTQDQSKLNNRITLDQLEAKYTTIPWTEYLNEILAPYAHVDRNEEVVVAVPSYLENFSKSIEKVPKRVLANYVCTRTIMQSIGNMGQKMLDIEAEARAAISGITKPQQRSTKCIHSLANNLPTAVGWLYMKSFFDNDSKIQVNDLIENLRSSLHSLIEQADWMDETSKRAALDKLHSVKSYAGYPDELGNVDVLNEYYQNVTLTPASFLKSELNVKQFMKNMLYSSLRKPVDYMKWVDYSTATLANAVYYHSVNSFDLPAGILQGHFFNKSRPHYMNYGATGVLVGHEISHAFDVVGSQFDKNGNLIDWWKAETKEEYSKKAKCIEEQYGNYTVKEVNMTVDGVNTQSENIADNIGLKAAYLAYNKWTQKNSQEPQLPGLNYTPQQMFWISYANNWCAKMTSEALNNLMVDNNHSPEEFRVIGSVSNMPKFSEDFKCPLGSPMNPVKKCSVW